VRSRLWGGCVSTAKTAFLLSGALLLIAASPIPQALARTWATNANVQSADAIVVLGGGVTWPGHLLCGSLYRLQHGVRLYHEGYAPRLILTGGANPRHPAVPAEAVIMQKMAVALGVRPEDIVLETQATRTYENGLNVARLMRQEAWESAVIVTDAIHMRRAQYVFQRLGIRIYPSAGRTRGLKTSGPGGGLLLLERLGREMVGLAVYKLRGWA
jgi:uncharacterized SAM-binding protein YcdF (DUF218 family)